MRTLALIALLILAACSVLDEKREAIRRADTANFAQTELVGLLKADILACAGRPARTVKTGDTETLTYLSGGDGDATAGSETKEKPCEVTFVLRDGFVEKLEYSVPDVGIFGKGDQCAFVVQKCVRTH